MGGGGSGPEVLGARDLARVTRDLCRPLESRAGALWYAGLAGALLLLAGGVLAAAPLLRAGLGTWGQNRSVGWALDVTNFVFWIGIAHAGTLLSAILFLLRQPWRTAVHRSAEAMTLIAVLCAVAYPLLHLGRPGLAYWVLPVPNARGPLWVNWRSPLVWDAFAIGTYFLVSVAFAWVGMLPDLATLRDRVRSGPRRRLWSALSLGWDGTARTWHRHGAVYLLLAGLATPLVLSVHSVVSFDFAVTALPGWHSTVFPPYFVAGALFSGLAMVLTLTLVARRTMRLEEYVTRDHVDAMCRLLLAGSLFLGLAYGLEAFFAWYAGSGAERFAYLNRVLGPFGWAFWAMLACTLVAPQALWWRRVRRNLPAVFALSLVVNAGMWLERFVIVVSSLHRDRLPATWTGYAPTAGEILLLLGGFGLFFTLYLLFCRLLPVVAMAEVKREDAGAAGGRS